MRSIITGAAGLVGSNLSRALTSQHEVRALSHADLDITERAAAQKIMDDLKPDVIWNCAVLQVDDCERDPAKAEAVNAQGPRFVAEAGQRIGATIVHFSTQYAFAGEPVGRAPYTIDDAPRPVNVYGTTKVAGEEAVRAACARSFIVRTSWVYGSGKDSFLCTVHDDLAAGRKVRAIDDIWSSTTYVDDLVARTLEILRMRRYGTYHVVNQGVCSYYEFGLQAGRLAGLRDEQVNSLIEVNHERDMKRVAARPRYTPMDCLLSKELKLAPMRDWRVALAAYVATKRNR